MTNKYRRRAALAFRIAAVLGFSVVVLAGIAVGTNWAWFDVAGPILIGIFGIVFLAMVVFWVLNLFHREPAATKEQWKAPTG